MTRLAGVESFLTGEGWRSGTGLTSWRSATSVSSREAALLEAVSSSRSGKMATIWSWFTVGSVTSSWFAEGTNDVVFYLYSSFTVNVHLPTGMMCRPSDSNLNS